MESVRFVVTQAGCSSCAARIRVALEPLATIEAIEVDEKADTAAVILLAQSLLSEDAISQALDDASAGSGHRYGVQADSWVSKPA